MKILIIGGGQVGVYLAHRLIASDHSVRLLEQDEHRSLTLTPMFPDEVICHCDGTDPTALQAQGIESADVVACVTQNDEVNLVCATLAKYEFGVDRVIARVNNPTNAWLFDATNGVDEAINQAEVMSQVIQENLKIDDMMTLMHLGAGYYSIMEAHVGAQSRIVGHDLSAFDLPAETLIIALTRQGEMLIPNGDTVIEAGDDLVVFTNEHSVDALRALFN